MNKSTMQSFGDNQHHKGFYLFESENISQSISQIKNPEWNFEDIDNDCDGFSYQDADVFRMGSCQLFSLALNQIMNLPAYEFRGEDGRLIHAFCIFDFSGKKAYIDVRGATTDLWEFLAGLPIGSDEKILCTPQDIIADMKNLTADEKLGYDFALYVIQKNPSFYSVE